MHIETFVVSPFQENCYVVHDGAEAALIDPGTYTAAERERVERYIDAEGLRVRHLLLTHAHLDHVFGCAPFARRYPEAEHGGWQLHPADRPILDDVPQRAALYGVPCEAPPPPAHALAHGDTVRLGAATWRVLHVPGHSPGSVAFYDAENGFVIGGDVLFQGSIGRTDLWGGSLDTLLGAIRTHLWPLPDETVVYPGHGPTTSIGAEKRSNPFLQ